MNIGMEKRPVLSTENVLRRSARSRIHLSCDQTAFNIHAKKKIIEGMMKYIKLVERASVLLFATHCTSPSV